jgi:hypothetical protein
LCLYYSEKLAGGGGICIGAIVIFDFLFELAAITVFSPQFIYQFT